MKQRTSRREFMGELLGASLAPSFLGSTAEASPPLGTTTSEPRIFLEPFGYEGVRLLDGMLKKQYEATRDFYYNIPDDDILLGFRQRAGLPAPGKALPGWYGGDVFNTFGQWLSGMARMSKATGDQAIRAKAVRLMTEWGKTIEPDGYFYYSRNPIMPHYTYEKMVCGLVDLYQYAEEKQALPLLDKITDWAMRNLDRSRKNPTPQDPAAGGTEWYTLCENLYHACLLTGNSKYKTFGDLWRYPHYWGMFSGRQEPAPYGLHAYSHCNTLSSAAMTYRITGDPQYLRTIVNAYDYFKRTQFYATGGWGPNESLVRPDGSLGKSLETTIRTYETPCGSWACFKLGKYLLEFTGEARYGDWMESMVYNGIGAALPMAGRGETFYYSDYNIFGARKVYFAESFPCCSGTYSQAVPDYHDIIYFRDSANLYVNLFVPSQVTWNHQGNLVHVEQETSYPEAGTTTLTITPARSATFGLKFRVPEWCQEASVSVNDARQPIQCRPGQWATVQRRWLPRDRVTIHLPMRPRLFAIDLQHPNRVAIAVGPAVLVRMHGPRLAVSGRDPGQWLNPQGRPLEYRIGPQPTGPFVPFYRVAGYSPTYAMYFDLET